jgi:putative tryptophan/tyrosine transport system substrate-binding protein
VRRRIFITVLGGVVSWPLAARAQQKAMPVIGLLGSASPGGAALFTAALREGLRAHRICRGTKFGDRIPLVGGRL